MGADEAWSTAKWVAAGSGVAKAIVAGVNMFMSAHMALYISSILSIGQESALLYLTH